MANPFTPQCPIVTEEALISQLELCQARTRFEKCDADLRALAALSDDADYNTILLDDYRLHGGEWRAEEFLDGLSGIFAPCDFDTFDTYKRLAAHIRKLELETIREMKRTAA